MKAKGYITSICFCVICFLAAGCGSATETTEINKDMIKNNSSIVYENTFEDDEATINENEENEKEKITEEKNNDTKEEVEDTNIDEDEKDEPQDINNDNEEKITVVLDPGHGKGGNQEMEEQCPGTGIMKIKDPGGAQGIATRVPEYEINFRVAQKLKSLLEQNNINVIMTRNDNSYSPGNIARAEVGNENNASLLIRIHCDSSDNSSAHGASMLVPSGEGYSSPVKDISRQYGEIILNSLVETAGMSNRGTVERGDLTGFNWSKVPVVLVEMGFMSNPEEDNLLNSDEYEDKLAQGLCNGILSALRGN